MMNPDTTELHRVIRIQKQRAYVLAGMTITRSRVALSLLARQDSFRPAASFVGLGGATLRGYDFLTPGPLSPVEPKTPFSSRSKV